MAVLAIAAGFGLRIALEAEPAKSDVAGTPPERGLAVMLEEPEAEVRNLELSPDGSRLAWTQNDGVFVPSTLNTQRWTFALKRCLAG